MRVHITVLNNIDGVAKNVQADVAKIVSGMGWHEIGLFLYYMNGESDEQLRIRIDGVISSLSYDDVVIFQYPSWIGRRYDSELINRVKVYSDKLIIFVHDLSSLLWEMAGPNGENLRQEISLLNRADLLVLASHELHETLRSYGLRDIPVVYQKIWEVPTELVITHHDPIKRLLFTGGDDLSFYTGRTPIYQFSVEDMTGGSHSIKWCHFRDMLILL